MKAARNELILDVAAEGFWDWDMQADRAYLSPRYCELIGYSPAETVFDSAFLKSIVHPDDRERVFATIEAHCQGKKGLSVIEYRVISRDGTVRWIEGRGKAVEFDNLGSPTRMVGTIVDISTRKHAEEQLRLSEQKYASVFHTSPDAIILTSLRDGTYLEVSEAFALMTGYTLDETIGNSSLSLNIWVNPAERQRFMVEVEQQGVVRGMEAEFRRKDGTFFTGQLTACPIEIEGEPCILSVARDISAHKQAMKALRDNEENLRAIMDAMPVCIAITDGTTIEYLNRCFIEHFGYAAEEIPTDDEWFRRAYPDPEYRQALTSTWRADLVAARLNGTPLAPREALVTCKDGTVRQTLANTQLIRDRILVIFTDLTEHERVQRELLKIQKLESLGVLAGGIAHDFNNILTGIMGNISFAKMLLDPGHEACGPLDRAEKASGRAADLARQLLVFAKGSQPVKRMLDVRKVVDDAVSLALSGTPVKAEFEMPAELHAVEADEGQLSQACHSIVINAVEAMPEGGKLTVCGENLVLDERNALGLPGGNYVRITFTDQGCGISEEDQKRIFDPYFSTKAGGTGLGLASTYAIVAKHGGRITVTSTVGVGTVFTIYLPSNGTAETAHHQANSVAAVDRSAETILVMDDDEMIRELATITLRRAGYAVTTCADGDEAIALYRVALAGGAPFTVTIMDLTIPGGMGGVEAARRILAIDPAAVLIVSSGYSEDPVMANFKTYGFSAAIEKPYKVEDILRTLRSLKERTVNR